MYRPDYPHLEFRPEDCEHEHEVHVFAIGQREPEMHCRGCGRVRERLPFEEDGDYVVRTPRAER